MYCNFCSLQTTAEALMTNGVLTICRVCASEFRHEDFVPFLSVERCSICSTKVVKKAQDYSNWDGRSPQPLICPECVVQYSPEKTKDSVEGLRTIIGDA